MSEVIGQLTITGTQAQIDAVRSTAVKAQTALGPRIQPTTVVFKPATQMPKRADGGPSFGYSRPSQHRALLLDDLEEPGYNPAKILAREQKFVQRGDNLEDANIARTTREQERERAMARTMALVGLAAAIGGFVLSLLTRLLGIGS